MPRNPDKVRCAVPGCRNWAMRRNVVQIPSEGEVHHKYCRSHREAELGQRDVGAPIGNLNALKHGRYSHPLERSGNPDFERLVATALDRPADLPFQVGLAVRAIQARTSDPFLVLVALRALLSQLTGRVASDLFARELRDALARLPPFERDYHIQKIERLAARKSPEDMLLLLRKSRSR